MRLHGPAPRVISNSVAICARAKGDQWVISVAISAGICYSADTSGSVAISARGRYRVAISAGDEPQRRHQRGHPLSAAISVATIVCVQLLDGRSPRMISYSVAISTCDQLGLGHQRGHQRL